MRSGSVPIGKVAGIKITVHYSWLFIFLLITFSLGTGLFPRTVPGLSSAGYWLLGAGAALGLFASVLIHELAHSLVARSRGIPVEQITLFIFGGVSSLGKDASQPGDEFVVTIVGPLSSLVLSGLFFGVSVLLTTAGAAASAFFGYLATINVMLAVFNLIPGFPLDGGRALRAALWFFMKNKQRATDIAATIGAGVGYLMVLGGLFLAFFVGDVLGGIWIAFIGWFLSNAAQSSAADTRLRERYGHVQVQRLLRSSVTRVQARESLDDVVHDTILPQLAEAIVVEDGDNYVGLLLPSDLRDVPRERWSTVTAGQLAATKRQFAPISPYATLEEALDRFRALDTEVLPVATDGQVVGVLSQTDLLRYITISEQAGLDASGMPRPPSPSQPGAMPRR